MHPLQLGYKNDHDGGGGKASGLAMALKGEAKGWKEGELLAPAFPGRRKMDGGGIRTRRDDNVERRKLWSGLAMALKG